MESTSLLKEVIDLILEWSPDLGIITSILSALLLVSAIMRTFFRVWNKTSLEKMLTPKYDAMWEDFLEHILLSLIMTLTIIGVGYALGENLNFSDNKTLALSLMIALFLILVKYAVMGVSILFPKVKRYIRRSYNLKQVIRFILILGYLSIIYMAVIMISIYVDNAINENIPFRNQVSDLFLNGLIYVAIFTIVSSVLRWFSNENHFFNIHEGVYKVSKIKSDELKNLYFHYAMKEDIHILSNFKDYADSEYKQVYVYYVNDDILLKYDYQKPEEKTKRKTKFFRKISNQIVIYLNGLKPKIELKIKSLGTDDKKRSNHTGSPVCVKCNKPINIDYCYSCYTEEKNRENESDKIRN